MIPFKGMGLRSKRLRGRRRSVIIGRRKQILQIQEEQSGSLRVLWQKEEQAGTMELSPRPRVSLKVGRTPQVPGTEVGRPWRRKEQKAL